MSTDLVSSQRVNTLGAEDEGEKERMSAFGKFRLILIH